MKANSDSVFPLEDYIVENDTNAGVYSPSLLRIQLPVIFIEPKLKRCGNRLLAKLVYIFQNGHIIVSKVNTLSLIHI